MTLHSTKAVVAASVVVPTRGGAARLPLLLERLNAQTRRNFEIIVVVDGDVDGSENVLRAWMAQHPGSMLRSVVLPENRGRSAALNVGFETARGRVLIRCDDDLEPSPNFVELHVSSHTDELSGVIGLYANVLPETVYARNYGIASDRSFREQAMATACDQQWRYWAGNVSVTRATWTLVGGYDEDYRRYGWEDVDYGYRLHAAGVRVRIASELTTRHHVAATTTAVRATRALHSGAAREIFLRKHGEDVLPDSTGDNAPWNAVVRGVASQLTEDRIQYWGDAIDRVADHLPAQIASKAIALLVESAAHAGIHSPDKAKSTF